ncbi:MAG: MFS transporter [Actinobacteria bacterium]|nr:MAG: MFS transporter [Actinomycetota bacterium]
MRERGGLWRDRDYLRFWTAHTVSQVGTQITQLALPLVAIDVLHASTFEVALLTFVDFLPWLVVSLPAGVWIDRLRRRPVLIAADIGRAVALAWVPAGAALGSLTVWQLYAVGFLVGCGTVFFDVAYQSYVPSLVGRDRLIEANSKLELSRSAAQLGGPAAGGGLVVALTAPYAILADAVSYVVSALLLGAIRREEHEPEPATTRVRSELLSGLRLVLGDPRTRSLVFYVATSTFSNGLFWAIFLLFARRELHLSAGLIGLVLALSNIGSLLGATIAGPLGRRLGIGRTLVAAGLVSGPPLFLVPLAPHAFPVPFLTAGLLVFGLGVIVYNITAISLIQSITPPHLLGRANASRRFLVWGPLPLGALAGGVFGSSIGLRETLLAAAAIDAAAVVWLLREPLRTIGELPQPEPLTPPPVEPVLGVTLE